MEGEENESSKRIALSAAFGGSGYRSLGGGGNGSDWTKDRGEVYARLSNVEERCHKLEEEIRQEFREFRRQFADHRKEEAERMDGVHTAIAETKAALSGLASKAGLIAAIVTTVIGGLSVALFRLILPT